MAKMASFDMPWKSCLKEKQTVSMANDTSFNPAVIATQVGPAWQVGTGISREADWTGSLDSGLDWPFVRLWGVLAN